MDVQTVTGFLQPLEGVKRQPNGSVAIRTEVVLGARFCLLCRGGIARSFVRARLVNFVLHLDGVEGQWTGNLKLLRPRVQSGAGENDNEGKANFLAHVTSCRRDFIRDLSNNR